MMHTRHLYVTPAGKAKKLVRKAPPASSKKLTPATKGKPKATPAAQITKTAQAKTSAKSVKQAGKARKSPLKAKGTIAKPIR